VPPSAVETRQRIAVVGANGAGKTTLLTLISGARELRVKESDRIAAMAAGLSAMGASIEEREDGWAIEGPVRLRGAAVESQGDHRVAMALAVAGLLAEGETQVAGAECVGVSYPGFWDDLASLCD